MRCLSIRQPWAWLICAGKKTIENRVWKTPFRGTIAIHASTTKTEVGRLKKDFGTNLFSASDFHYGAIIGFADIIDIQPYGRVHEQDGFACGPYCFQLANGRLLKEPVPMMGKLNLFELDDEVAAKLEIAETYTVDLSSESSDSKIANVFEFKPDPVSTYASVIEELQDKLSLDQVVEMCNRMVELEPDNGEGYFQRCKVALVHGRDENVLSDADKLLSIWPDDIDMMSIVAEVKVYANQYEEAQKLLEILVQREPNLPALHVLLGQSLFELNDFQRSAVQFASALECGPTEQDAEWCHIMLARAYHRIDELDRAAEHIGLAKSYNSGLAIVPTVAARISLKLGQYEVAQSEVEAALRIDPKYAAALQIRDELKSLK